MKKLICLVLTVIFIISLVSVSFAATETDPIPDWEKQNNTVIIEDQGTPGAAVNIVDSKTALPKTGGIPAEAFYVAGALIVVAALVLSKVKSKPATKS